MDAEKAERTVVETGGGPPLVSAYVINGHPGPLYDCSEHGNQFVGVTF